jgi:hypothetical protein
LEVILVSSISKLKLSSFIDAIIDNDFSGLIIQGQPNEEQIAACFENIYLQYIEAAGGKDLVDDLEGMAIQGSKQSMLKRMESLLKCIEMEPCEELYNMLLNDFNYEVEQLPYSEENLANAVRSVMPFYRLDKTRLEIEMAEQNNEPKEAIKYTREYFNAWLIEISTAFKLNILEHEIAVNGFCGWMNKYNVYRKQLEKANANN